jgi:hypothetical protein
MHLCTYSMAFKTSIRAAAASFAGAASSFSPSDMSTSWESSFPVPFSVAAISPLKLSSVMFRKPPRSACTRDMNSATLLGLRSLMGQGRREKGRDEEFEDMLSAASSSGSNRAAREEAPSFSFVSPLPLPSWRYYFGGIFGCGRAGEGGQPCVGC